MEKTILKYTIIKTREQYDTYCKNLEGLLSSEITGPIQDEADLLTLLIETYDDAHDTFAEFKEDMLEEVKRIMKECVNGAPGKKWLKSAEVKKLLGISHGFLQSLRDSGVLPYTKIGGSIYYDYEDITFMMSANKSA
jgi:Fic family protein